MTNIKEEFEIKTILKTQFWKNLVKVNCKAQSESIKALTPETLPIKMWTTKKWAIMGNFNG